MMARHPASAHLWQGIGALQGLPRPHLLALMPVLATLAWLIGGTTTMVLVMLAFPVGLALAPLPLADTGRDAVTGLADRSAVAAALDAGLRAIARTTSGTAAIVLEIDRFRLIEERHDRAVIERILRVTARRLTATLRDADVAARLDGATFAVGLSPIKRLDLDTAIHLVGRLQRALSEPIRFEGVTVHPTVSVGFALTSRIDRPTGTGLLQAATLAMLEAQRSGPAAIRSYSAAMKGRIASRSDLSDQVARALDQGEITAFFQPQISSCTSDITGFEALARWHHPTRGLIPPVEFLPALEQAGLMASLGEVMTRAALTALNHWDAAGFAIPRVAVNFSTEELSDPHLLNRIAWEVDRMDLTPDRLVVEVLETVVAARAADTVITNLSGLAKLGCCLDLDDFGTGHASITSIRRFSIERIKIDRSFVTGIDGDLEQQKMVAAILTMADRLGLDTLAEGVETAAERDMLVRLGCGHLQGFGIARPMPFDQTDTWIMAYQARHNGDNLMALAR